MVKGLSVDMFVSKLMDSDDSCSYLQSWLGFSFCLVQYTLNHNLALPLPPSLKSKDEIQYL